MAYAAILADLNPRYMDTTKAIVGHPVFPVCLEWPAILATRALAGSRGLTDSESAMGVHAAHDLHLYRPIRADETLRTNATVVDVQGIRPGAASVMRLDTWDEHNELVCQTYQTSIYRGVEVIGDGNSIAMPTPSLPAQATAFNLAKTVTIAVDGGLAHSYSECAHIWNPIHTDKAVALAAGLPDIILHGTATLALAISALVDHCLGGDPDRVTRLGGRFAAMVLMPSDIELEIGHPVDGCIGYRVLNAQGQEAISQGFLAYR
jgi:acyl dehydratase